MGVASTRSETSASGFGWVPQGGIVNAQAGRGGGYTREMGRTRRSFLGVPKFLTGRGINAKGRRTWEEVSAKGHREWGEVVGLPRGT